jgi:hypothetical protein
LDRVREFQGKVVGAVPQSKKHRANVSVGVASGGTAELIIALPEPGVGMDAEERFAESNEN